MKTRSKYFSPTRVTFAALATVVLAALTGCGTDDGDDLLPPVKVDAAPDAHYLGTLDEPTNLATEQLDARYERWAGDVALEQASAAILSYYDNAPMAACVAEQDLQFNWEGGIQPVPEPSVFEGHDELSPPTLEQSTLAQTNVEAEHLMSQLDETPPEPLNTATAECSFQIHQYGPELLEGYSDEDLQDLLAPTSRGELAALWEAEIAKVTKILDVSNAAIGTCLADGELPDEFSDLSSNATLDDYRAVVETAIEQTSAAPLRGGDRSAAWRDVVKTEEALELAAWECKKPFYAEGIVQLNEAMDRFETRHTDKILQAIDANQKIHDLATKLGWSTERPIGSLSQTEPPR